MLRGKENCLFSATANIKVIRGETFLTIVKRRNSFFQSLVRSFVNSESVNVKLHFYINILAAALHDGILIGSYNRRIYFIFGEMSHNLNHNNRT